jgi:NAD(P)-dependent dehydrogenase (short-subunit alcohol dehydrogenase family)
VKPVPLRAADLFDVTGLVTVVTGGASGIGYGYADVMGANGAEVTLIDRDADGLAAAVKELASGGAKVRGETADVTDKASLRRAVDAVAQRHGRIDVVFANAGISAGPGFLTTERKRDPQRAVENIADEVWERVIATNLTSVFHTIQVVVPHMKQRGGRIIVTSSISATKVEQFVGMPYVTAKAGVAQLVRQVALELARYNIAVNAIAPGPCVTNIGGGRLQDPVNQAFFAQFSPQHRMATPDDMQGAALFFASAASKHVTGAHIVIDGGVTLGVTD